MASAAASPISDFMTKPWRAFGALPARPAVCNIITLQIPCRHAEVQAKQVSKGDGQQTSDLLLAARFDWRPSLANGLHERASQKMREAERRKARIQPAAPHSRVLPPGNASGAARATDNSLARTTRFGRARLPALHCGFRRRANAFNSIKAALHAMKCEGITLALCTALKPSTWLAGRHAGGDDALTARVGIAGDIPTTKRGGEHGCRHRKARASIDWRAGGANATRLEDGDAPKSGQMNTQNPQNEEDNAHPNSGENDHYEYLGHVAHGTAV